jgi:hypothetical protein
MPPILADLDGELPKSREPRDRYLLLALSSSPLRFEFGQMGAEPLDRGFRVACPRCGNGCHDAPMLAHVVRDVPRDSLP